MGMTFHCKPKRLFSWTYRVAGEGHEALLEFRWADETGTITVGGTRLDIAEDGGLGGRWTLRNGEDVVAVGRRAAPDPPTFTVQRSPMGSLRIRAIGRTQRSFTIERGGKLIGRIDPAHALTRRARIETTLDECDFLTMTFLFWIVVVSWRRAVSDV